MMEMLTKKALYHLYLLTIASISSHCVSSQVMSGKYHNDHLSRFVSSILGDRYYEKYKAYYWTITD